MINNYENKRFNLSNGESITFSRWIPDVKGNQYFIAINQENKEEIYHVVSRDKNNNIAKIEKVK